MLNESIDFSEEIKNNNMCCCNICEKVKALYGNDTAPIPMDAWLLVQEVDKECSRTTLSNLIKSAIQATDDQNCTDKKKIGSITIVGTDTELFESITSFGTPIVDSTTDPNNVAVTLPYTNEECSPVDIKFTIPIPTPVSVYNSIDLKFDANGDLIVEAVYTDDDGVVHTITDTTPITLPKNEDYVLYTGNNTVPSGPPPDGVDTAVLANGDRYEWNGTAWVLIPPIVFPEYVTCDDTPLLVTDKVITTATMGLRASGYTKVSDGQGCLNQADDYYDSALRSWIGGRQIEANTSLGSYSRIAMGRLNSMAATGDYSFIGAGSNNEVNGTYSTVVAGTQNDIIVGSSYSGILSGTGNKVTGTRSGIGVGNANIVTAGYSWISTGTGNDILGGSYNSISTGNNNQILQGSYNHIANGLGNKIDGGSYHFISGYSNEINGGNFNTVQSYNNEITAGSYNSIVGGTGHIIASGNQNQILSGYNQRMSGSQNTGAGSRHTTSGTNNFVTGDLSTVSSSRNLVGGYRHTVTSSDNLVSGYQHTVSSYRNVVGGYLNNVSGYVNGVFGQRHTITGNRGLIAGELNTFSDAIGKAIGYNNNVNGTSYNFVEGTNNRITAGSYSHVFGRSLTASQSDTITLGRLATNNVNGGILIGGATNRLGFFGTAPIAKQTANTLPQLLAALKAYGIIA